MKEYALGLIVYKLSDLESRQNCLTIITHIYDTYNQWFKLTYTNPANSLCTLVQHFSSKQDCFTYKFYGFVLVKCLFIFISTKQTN